MNETEKEMYCFERSMMLVAEQLIPASELFVMTNKIFAQIFGKRENDLPQLKEQCSGHDITDGSHSAGSKSQG